MIIENDMLYRAEPPSEQELDALRDISFDHCHPVEAPPGYIVKHPLYPPLVDFQRPIHADG